MCPIPNFRANWTIKIREAAKSALGIMNLALNLELVSETP